MNLKEFHLGREPVAVVAKLGILQRKPVADAQHLVDQLSREHLEDTALLEVVLLSEPMPRNTPQRLGLSVHAWIGDSPSTAFVKAVGAPVFATPQPVLAAWSTLREELHGWDAPTTQ